MVWVIVRGVISPGEEKSLKLERFAKHVGFYCFKPGLKE